MVKRTEKSIIVIDGIIQSPMAFTPVTTTLVNNAGSGISTTTTDFVLILLQILILEIILNLVMNLCL